MKQAPQPRICAACGEPLPAGCHGLQQYCRVCQIARRKAKARRLQRRWRERHPLFWRTWGKSPRDGH